MRRLFCLFALLASVTAAADATSYVMKHDSSLVDEAPAIVRVRIESTDNDPTGPRTLYRATVLETLKGSVGPEITLSVPGGRNQAGLTWKVFGSPEFRAGDEALVFASWREDGTWAPYQLMLGTFHERNVAGKRVALRDLSEAHQMGPASAGADRARSLAPFSTWIRDRVAGVERDPDYFVEVDAKDLRPALDAFTYINDPDIPIRFFEFDTGGSVPWFMNANGTALTQQAVTQAMNAWNGENRTPIKLAYGGTSGATGGLGEAKDYDEVNVVLGGDPKNQASGSFSCFTGGVLAIGGPWFDGTEEKFNGKTYYAAIGADIVTNNGTDCWFSNPQDAAEVLTHEFGHTLGLGHSCGDSGSPACVPGSALDDATMRAQAHGDGRGASLRSDDIAGIRSLYRANTGGGGAKPAAPTDLTAEGVSTSQVQLAWEDTSTNETGFTIEMADLGSVFAAAKVGSTPAGAEFTPVLNVNANLESATISGLAPATHYLFRVRSKGNNGDSDYSNEATAVTDGTPGTCAEDQDTLCLNAGRFQVTATWETASATGVAKAKELTADTGYFYFFNEKNVEIVIKVLTNCGQSGNYWVFVSGLTDQGAVIVVQDTDTGKIKVYENTRAVPFVFQRDFTAFACS